MDSPILVNPAEHSWHGPQLWLVSLGAYGWTRLLVWAGSCSDAIDTVIDEHIIDYAPGYLVTDEEIKELICEELEGSDRTWEEFTSAIEAGEQWPWDVEASATTDLYCGGNCGTWISADWGICEIDSDDPLYRSAVLQSIADGVPKLAELTEQVADSLDSLADCWLVDGQALIRLGVDRSGDDWTIYDDIDLYRRSWLPDSGFWSSVWCSVDADPEVVSRELLRNVCWLIGLEEVGS